MNAKKILVVDDDKPLRKLLENRLAERNYESIMAGNGDEALSIVSKERVDLIVLDVCMPKMDGYTFFQSMRKLDQCKAIPVIVLTAKEHLQDLFDMEGIAGYLVKPVNVNHLLEQVEAQLK